MTPWKVGKVLVGPTAYGCKNLYSGNMLCYFTSRSVQMSLISKSTLKTSEIHNLFSAYGSHTTKQLQLLTGWLGIERTYSTGSSDLRDSYWVVIAQTGNSNTPVTKGFWMRCCARRASGCISQKLKESGSTENNRTYHISKRYFYVEDSTHYCVHTSVVSGNTSIKI